MIELDPLEQLQREQGTVAVLVGLAALEAKAADVCRGRLELTEAAAHAGLADAIRGIARHAFGAPTGTRERQTRQPRPKRKGD